MARIQVKRLVEGTSSPDGRKITFEVELTTGGRHTLVFDFAEADALGVGILQVAGQAYERQIEAGLLPQTVHGDAAIDVLSCRVHYEPPLDRVLVQAFARVAAEAPLEAGSFRLEPSLADQLGRDLVETARFARQRRRPN